MKTKSQSEIKGFMQKNSSRTKFNKLALQALARATYQKNNQDIVALTVDIHHYTPNIGLLLKIIKKEKIPVTFFFTGKCCEENSFLLPYITTHYPTIEIGNHSYSHRDFTQLSRNEITQEFIQTEQLFAKSTNISPCKLFRFPYGHMNSDAIQIAHERGYSIISWTLDIHDSLPNISITKMQDRLLSCKPYDIILMHTANANAIIALANSIPILLKERGYQFVLISQLFNLPF